MTRSTLIVVSLIASFGLFACGIESEPLPTPSPYPQDPTPQDPTPQDPTPQDPKVDPPVLDVGLQSTTCSETFALTGTATAGGTVFATGGASSSGISTDVHPQTGAFCLPVTLKLGTNALEVRVQDPVNGLSEAVMFTVTRQDCQGGGDDTQPTDPEQPDPRNIALGLQATAMATPNKGNFGFLTDGKSSTSASFSGGDWYCPWCDYAGWVSLKLDKIYKLSEIKVRWRDSKTSAEKFYGQQYKVLVSSMTDPGDPNIDNGLWTEVGTVTDGDGNLDTFNLKSTQPLVQHVALWLKKDGSWNWNETFAVAEIEVWDAPDKVTAPPVTTEACQ
jgi:hypothetical protein